jgi:hypothetical protein
VADGKAQRLGIECARAFQSPTQTAKCEIATSATSLI